MIPEPPYSTADGITLGRARIEKTFEGPLTATGEVQMTSARCPESSAVYVAIERIEGTLDGKRGSFVAHHVGLSDRGAHSLSIAIVPDSGTGDLRGIRGTIGIQIVDGKHLYELDYSLG
jgi:hypothetical protein